MHSKPGLVAGWALLCLVGCDTWHAQNVRPKQDESLALSSSGEVDDQPAEAKQMVKGFFKPTRPPGGWSPEANEIESHLGIR